MNKILTDIVYQSIMDEIDKLDIGWMSPDKILVEKRENARSEYNNKWDSICRKYGVEPEVFERELEYRIINSKRIKQ